MFRTVLTALTFSLVAGASTISFQTSGGALSSTGQPVSASATVTTGAGGSVTVTLSDLLANPTDAGQLVSDFFFNLSTAPTTSLSGTTTPTGSLIAIDGNGIATTSNVAIASWGLTSSGSTVHLDSLTGGPSQTIIGPGGPGGVYTNANGSIAGNGPHNPFLSGSATFTFTVAGVTTNTTVSNPVFSFGTVAGDNVPGCVVGAASCNSSTVPEPVTSGLVGLGLISLFFVRRRATR